MTTAVSCGGDADTTAAIVGGIVGARVGRDQIPDEWIDGIWESPRSVTWMTTLGERLSVSDFLRDPLPKGALTKASTMAPTVNPFAVFSRNLFFLFIVLLHGFRRLAPPYS